MTTREDAIKALAESIVMIARHDLARPASLIADMKAHRREVEAWAAPIERALRDFAEAIREETLRSVASCPHADKS